LVYPAFLRLLRQTLARPGRPWVADVAVYFDAGAPPLGLPVVLVQAPLSLRVARLRRLGVTAGRARSRAAALRFGAAERQAADLVLDGRQTVASNTKKLLALHKEASRPHGPS
jgi:hypothetical protein